MMTTANAETRAAGFVAFSGREVLGYDSNADRLTEAMMETFDPDRFSVRAVTDRVLELVKAGDDCVSVRLIDVGFDGFVYDLAD